MSGTRGDWQRVRKSRPCPVCGRPDWCLIAGPEDFPTAAICQRSRKPQAVRRGRVATPSPG